MHIGYSDLNLMKDLGISIEEVVILKAKVEGSDILLHFTPSKKSYENLREKGLLNQDNSVSSYGRTLIAVGNQSQEGFENF